MIVYVGSSDYPSCRVFGHNNCPKKKFDQALYLAVSEDDLLRTEAFWIRTLKPQHNIAHNPQGHLVPEGWGAHISDKKYRNVSIPEPILIALQSLADEQFDTLASQVRKACRDRLVNHGKLPKPSGPSD